MFLLVVRTKVNISFWLVCIGSASICCSLWLDYVSGHFFGAFYLDAVVRSPYHMGEGLMHANSL